MKAKIVFITTIFSLLFNAVTLADGQAQTITVNFNSVNLNVNGTYVYADNILYNGTTYIPLRKTAETLGCEVGWDGETKTATLTQYNEKPHIAFVFHDLYKAKRICELCNDIYRITNFNFTKSYWNTTFHNSNKTYYEGIEENIKYISEYYESLKKYKDTMYILLSDITPRETLDNLYLKLDEAFNKSVYIYSLVKNLIESSGYICTEDEFTNDIRLLFEITDEIDYIYNILYSDYLLYLYN
ncbi:MAG: copper amine oxidase N-terminal domain-containing protein [Ruminococcaceae bacterium]|nr:copper amine oxidase N-terminal domain-containing protein [Oscillospiraceae bacterium]